MNTEEVLDHAIESGGRRLRAGLVGSGYRDPDENLASGGTYAVGDVIDVVGYPASERTEAESETFRSIAEVVVRKFRNDPTEYWGAMDEAMDPGLDVGRFLNGLP